MHRERDSCYVITLRAKFVKCGRVTTKYPRARSYHYFVVTFWSSHFKMSEQTGYSPSFKRPAEIMRMRRKRARSDAGAFGSSIGQGSTASPGQSASSPGCLRPFSPGPLFNTQNRSGGGIKRRNPFANIENTHSPRKKLVIYTDDNKAEAVDRNNPKTRTETEVEEDTQRGALAFSERLAQAERQEKHQETSSKVCPAI